MFIKPIMSYKQFLSWCNDRACDGRWSKENAVYCINVIDTINAQPFWKRNRIWNKSFALYVIYKIVLPTDSLIKKYEALYTKGEEK